MTDEAESKERVRGRMRIALAAIAVLALLFVVPPLISVNRYKGEITQLLSQSLGRPVHLSSVEVRLLPWPGFEISDLSVAEDPAYGSEPVLHANKVTASLRLLALWSGRVEIGKISVDEASLNVVRAGPGRWNLDPIFRTAAAETGSASNARRATPLPYLEATDSRINFKNGVEKLPFSLVNADLSFWQENPGEWRLRLRGQPARTDVSLYLEETGVVRVEASMRRAPSLSQMPLHLDIDWREAQLGQLARLITGSDPGWWGALTGELHLDGTADAAKVAMRLRATGVHRAEFTPASPLDFDANCGLVYHYAQRSVENLVCDSPLGDGHVHITGEKPGESAAPQFSVALDRIPVAAGLDALRTLRSGLAPDLEAKGTVSGRIGYDVSVPGGAEQAKAEPPVTAKRNHPAKASPENGPLTGSLTVEGLMLSGGGLSRPIEAPKFTLEPESIPAAAPRQAGAEAPETEGAREALAGTVAIAAGGTAPLTFNLRIAPSGYQVGVRGQAGIARARELAQAANIPVTAELASLAGEPIAVELTADGPWIPAEENPLENAAAAEGAPVNGPESAAEDLLPASKNPTAGGDAVTGTVTVRNANWKADYLAGHVVIDEAVLHIENGDLRWDPVEFTYGPLKGMASLTLPAECPALTPPEPCPAQFQMHFADLDAAALEGALLGARQKGTLISDLIERLHPSSAPPWPQLEGTVDAESLALGPVSLNGVSASLRIQPTGAEITSLDAGLLGGSVHLSGTLTKPATDQDKPGYTLSGDFEKLEAAEVGRLLGLRWTGAPLSGNGNVKLAGYTDSDLAASAKGTLHFECRQGSISGAKTAMADKAQEHAPAPAALAHFSRWTADASIGEGGIELGQNAIVADGRKQTVAATVAFGEPPEVRFGLAREARAEKQR